MFRQSLLFQRQSSSAQEAALNGVRAADSGTHDGVWTIALCTASAQAAACDEQSTSVALSSTPAHIFNSAQFKVFHQWRLDIGKGIVGLSEGTCKALQAGEQ